MSKFIEHYATERAKVFITLDGCKTHRQLQVARNFFDAFIKKWKPQAKEINHKVMLEMDEDLFNLKARLKEKNIPMPID